MRISDWSSDVCSSDLLVGLCRDAVAVDDHLAMIGRIIEELLANPAQVGQRLLVERYAGQDAGMNEDIVADFDHILSHAEEMDMLGRHELRQPLGDLFEGGRRIADRKSTRLKSRH